MEFDKNVNYLTDAFWQIVISAGPVLLVALAIGLTIGIIQAATSIQEMTLSFIPKLAVMMVAVAIFGEWQLAIMMEYFQTIFERVRVLNG